MEIVVHSKKSVSTSFKRNLGLTVYRKSESRLSLSCEHTVSEGTSLMPVKEAHRDERFFR